MLGKYKKVIVALVIIGGLFFAYNVFFVTNDVDTTLLRSSGSTTNAELLGADIIKAINQIDSLDLDRSVFDDPVFNALIDRGEELNEEPRGRTNPFAPIGTANSTVVEDTSTTTVEQ